MRSANPNRLRVAAPWRLATTLALAISFGAALSPSPAAAQESHRETPATADREAMPRPALPSAEQIDQWIAELSHDAFRVRQAAAARLLAAGTAARDALEKAADSPDPETRAAAVRLLALIRQSDFQRRLEKFAADVDGSRGLTLPGWERFRELVGDDPAARELFVEMQKQEHALLSAVFGGSAEPARQFWEERLERLRSWRMIGNPASGPPLGSCAAMFFLGALDDLDVSDRGVMMVDELIQRPAIGQALQSGGADGAVRRLVAAWIIHCPNKSEMGLQRRLASASAIDLKEALPLALAVAGGDPSYARVQPYVRATAILLVGQLGSAEHAQHLEPLLEDASVCIQGQMRVPGAVGPTVQVRDVALVVMVHLTGQRPMDYGYLHARLQPQRTFQPHTLHVENDVQRRRAIAKWHRWRRAEEGRESKVEGQGPEEETRDTN